MCPATTAPTSPHRNDRFIFQSTLVDSTWFDNDVANFSTRIPSKQTAPISVGANRPLSYWQVLQDREFHVPKRAVSADQREELEDTVDCATTSAKNSANDALSASASSPASTLPPLLVIPAATVSAHVPSNEFLRPVNPHNSADTHVNQWVSWLRFPGSR